MHNFRYLIHSTARISYAYARANLFTQTTDIPAKLRKGRNLISHVTDARNDDGKK